MANEYKLEKEAWVSNLSGGSILEINLVSAVAPTTVLLWSVLQSKQSFFYPYTPLACLLDFLLNSAGTLYGTTLLSSNPTTFNLLFVIPAITIYFTSGIRPQHTSTPRKPPTKVDASSHDTDPLPVKPFITHYRGTMMVATCSSILAVDFPIYPRRFAKAENWGTSLMDLGVGSFVFSAGVVAARPILKQQLAGAPQSIAVRLRSAIRHAVPLLVLGLIRLYSVKGLEYVEHVTEYGVHWNFFFTLALIPPLVAIFDAAFYYFPSYALLSLLIGVTYQVILDSTDLTAFILTAPRTDLLSKNREGIFSLIGYLAIFIAGQSTGTFILPRHSQTRNLWQNTLFRKLALSTAMWCGLFFLCTDYYYGAGLSVSRRIANLPYILWTAAFNSGLTLLLYLTEAILFPDLYDTKLTNEAAAKKRQFATSRLLRCFNRNGLAVFLIANLLTGLVNLTLPTIKMGDLAAMGVLIAYMAAVSGVALALDYFDVSIKL